MAEAIAAARGAKNSFAAMAKSNADAAWLGNVRESLLVNADRRTTGAYFTPVPLIRFLVERSLNPLLARVHSLKALSTFRVIDPAMGAGAFLLKALPFVASRAMELGASEQAMSIAASCLAGIDRDALSVRVAKESIAIAANVSADALPEIRVGDALTLPENALADAVIGNPPFAVLLGKSSHADEKARHAQAASLRARFSAQAGELELARLFLELTLDLVRPGGAVALVLPASVLADRSAGPLRARLRERCHTIEIIELPERARAFADVNQAVVLLRAERRSSQASGASALSIRAGVESVDAIDHATLFPVSPAALDSTDGRFPLLARSGEANLLAKLSRFPRLGESQFVRSLREGEVHLTRFASRLGATGTSLARGRDLEPWHITPSSRIDLEGEDPFLPRLRAARACERIAWPQIANRGLMRRLKAARLPAGVSAANTLGVLVPDPEFVPLLLALFHSRLWAWRLALTSSNNHILVSDVAALPVPNGNVPVSILKLVGDREDHKSDPAALDDALETMLAQMFELTASERKLLVKTKRPSRRS